ncbi:hypothetical protein HF650_02520 [Kosakonia sp. SMBL-WEM22]|uniref:hypothetical protein n=1 Tax=Kosakonia sp. SMBL-WEM22 TaxID=2725560 RepID=UPI001659B93B|nr:hypothetical protein [Kosakonia sp. SMBL-WEM22]MDV5354871.1 hypothetical protein [Enterobacter asburiae]QNQ18704.1 hypothetical protein HF650_02520 [Kosakonia sp. SMBL-WEM22]
MNKLNAIILSSACVCLLSACAGNASQQRKGDSAANVSSVNAVQGVATERKSPFFDGIVIASTNNACIDKFNFIRGTDTATYKNYSSDYSKIGEGYKFLNINKNIMGKEAKEIYTMQLDLKLDTLCAKAHYTSYQIVKEKMRNLANI